MNTPSLIIDICLESPQLGPYAVMETRPEKVSSTSNNFVEVTVCNLNEGDITQTEASRLSRMLSGESIGKGPFGGIGWLDSVLSWIQTSAGPRGFRFSGDVQQHSAKSSFGLARFGSADGTALWLKATSETCAHELPITEALSRCCIGFVPELIATKPSWNAWLTQDAGEPLSAQPVHNVLESIVHSLAEMQHASRSSLANLHRAGCIDLSLCTLRNCIPALSEYLMSAMARQRSQRVAPLEPNQITELAELLMEASMTLEKFEVGDVLLHNDLNPGNVLVRGSQIAFTDWAEAGIGHPWFGLHHLCALAVDLTQQAETVQHLSRLYAEHWQPFLTTKQIRRIHALSCPLAVVCYLCGRDPSFASTPRNNDSVQSYARGLARHLYRLVHEPAFREAL